MALGITQSWTSPALMRISEDLCLPDDCDITGVTEEEASWMAGAVYLGAAMTGPVTGLSSFTRQSLMF